MRKLALSSLILLTVTILNFQTPNNSDSIGKITQTEKKVRVKVKRIPGNNLKVIKMNVGPKALGFKIKKRNKLA